MIIAGIAGAAGPGLTAPPAYRLELPERLTVERGASGAISLTIAPAQGHVVSRDGPVRIDISAVPDSGLELTKSRYSRAESVDADAAAPRFDLAFVAALPGGYAVAIEVRFWICGSRTCRPVRESRTVDVAVEEVAPPAPPDAGPGPVVP